MSKRDIFPALHLDTVFTATLLKEIHRHVENYRNTGNWLRTDVGVFKDYLIDNESYYLIYEHPMHIYLNRGYQSTKLDLQQFIDKRIELSGDIGLDIWVLPVNKNWLISCNHDDDIFASRK